MDETQLIHSQYSGGLVQTPELWVCDLPKGLLSGMAFLSCLS